MPQALGLCKMMLGMSLIRGTLLLYTKLSGRPSVGKWLALFLQGRPCPRLRLSMSQLVNDWLQSWPAGGICCYLAGSELRCC